MRPLCCFIKRVLFKRPAATALCCLLIFFTGSRVQAQSGRRVPKRPPASTNTTPQPETKPATTPPVVKADDASLSFYVCLGQHDSFANIPFYYFETIRNVFIQRLEQASSAKVTTGPETPRGGAIKRAKAEASAYIVLLQLEVDTFDPRDSNNGIIDPSKLYIRYTVYAPVTGKVKLEGRTYQQQYRVGRGGVGLPSPKQTNTSYSDYLLKEAARDAANHVLEEFHVSPQLPRDPGLTSNSEL